MGDEHAIVGVAAGEEPRKSGGGAEEKKLGSGKNSLKCLPRVKRAGNCLILQRKSFE